MDAVVQTYMDSEIRAIMAQYMPLDNQNESIQSHLQDDDVWGFRAQVETSNKILYEISWYSILKARSAVCVAWNDLRIRVARRQASVGKHC